MLLWIRILWLVFRFTNGIYVRLLTYRNRINYRLLRGGLPSGFWYLFRLGSHPHRPQFVRSCQREQQVFEWPVLFRSRVGLVQPPREDIEAHKFRYCGNTTDYCNTGCQSGYGDCTATTVGSGQVTCGPAFGNAKCSGGQCCSAAVRISSVSDFLVINKPRATVELAKPIVLILTANGNSVPVIPAPRPLDRLR